VAVAGDVREALAGVAAGRPDAVEAALEARDRQREQAHLDPRTFALVKIAALIAVDAPPASFGWQVGAAIDAGVTPEEILGVLRAVAPQVGAPKVIAAAPEVMLALGLALPDAADYGNEG
jgi:alkylhydroperoxidase/carboxymuconolactone decarboxylase family protein YurZ